MPNLTGAPQIFSGDTDVVDTVLQHPLGSRAYDSDGNEYIYLEGVADTAQYDAVTYDENYATTRSTANAVGCLAVAQAAIVASSYGWYLIKGSGTVNVAAAVTADKQLYLTATAGHLDDADVAGDAVIGMISRTAATGEGTVTAQLNFPFVCDAALD